MSKLSICIATNKKEARKQIEAIKQTITTPLNDVEVFASCQDTSAAGNRNYCLDIAKGDIIIMMDDDIGGFYKGWDKDLIKPLEDEKVSIVSARLIDTKMSYDGTEFNIVPGGCTAFRKTAMRNDERYERGSEDIDWCLQMEIAHPDKHTMINENCKLTHPPQVDRKKDYAPALKLFREKWGLVHNRKEMDTTIIYYTGSTEATSFEKAVTDNILRLNSTRGYPIISVSQKPLDFGKNICVGEIGKNYRNAFMQVRIALLNAKTKYVTMCESDCLYPDGYFDFLPPKDADFDTVWTYDNVWLIWDRHNRTRFYKHGTTAGSIVLNREYYLSLCENGVPVFEGKDIKWKTFTGKPLVNVKTRNGVSFGTELTKGVKPRHELEGFGTVEDVKENYGLK